jgi:hypothetical protein
LRDRTRKQISKFEENRIDGNCRAQGEDGEGHRGEGHRLRANELPRAIGITRAMPRLTLRSDHGGFTIPFTRVDHGDAGSNLNAPLTIIYLEKLSF